MSRLCLKVYFFQPGMTYEPLRAQILSPASSVRQYSLSDTIYLKSQDASRLGTSSPAHPSGLAEIPEPPTMRIGR